MYTIEQKYALTDSMTPDEAARYYRRPRTIDELIYHWWNTVANRAKSPDNIYNYMVNNNKSVNYIVGWDDYQGKVRILALTPLNRVAMTTQSANIFSYSVEVDPLATTSDPRAYEIFKALGWLHSELEGRENKRLRAGIHKQYWQTECSPIVKARILSEADKWRSGQYDPAKPKPPIEGATIRYERIAPNDKPVIYKAKLQPTHLRNFNHKLWSDMESVLQFAQNDTIAIVGRALHSNGSKYLMTAHSFGKADETGQAAFTNGVNEVDLTKVVTTNPPATQPPKPPVVTPPPVPQPITVIKKDSYDPAKKFVVKNETILRNMPDGSIYKDAKGQQFVYPVGKPLDTIGEYVEYSNGRSYYRAAYSVLNKFDRGFIATDLEEFVETPPVTPPAPPTLPPSENSTIEDRLGALEKLVNKIIEVLSGLVSGEIFKK